MLKKYFSGIQNPLPNLAKKLLTFLMNKHSSNIHFHCFAIILFTDINESIINIHSRNRTWQPVVKHKLAHHCTKVASFRKFFSIIFFQQVLHDNLTTVDWMFLSTQNSCVKVLTPKMIVLEHWVCKEVIQMRP